MMPSCTAREFYPRGGAYESGEESGRRRKWASSKLKILPISILGGGGPWLAKQEVQNHSSTSFCRDVRETRKRGTAIFLHRGFERAFETGLRRIPDGRWVEEDVHHLFPLHTVRVLPSYSSGCGEEYLVVSYARAVGAASGVAAADTVVSSFRRGNLALSIYLSHPSALTLPWVRHLPTSSNVAKPHSRRSHHQVAAVGGHAKAG